MNFLSFLIKITFLLLAAAPFAYAASPFDGKWKGEGKPTSACTEKAEVVFTIKDGEFGQFALIGPRGRAENAKGIVSDSGSATVEYGSSRGLKGTLTFSGNSFEGKLDTRCGVRDFIGARE